MQLYFHERNADTEYQPNPFGDSETQSNAFTAMNKNVFASSDNCGKNDCFEEEKTSDIFGKPLI